MPEIAQPTRIREKPITTIEKLAQRFTIDENGCWLWNKPRPNTGYGVFRVFGMTRFAHRVMFELVGNDPIEGLYLDHLCRRRNCVNPSHVEQVTIKVNTMRGQGVTAINAAKTHCPQGHELSGDNLRLDISVRDGGYVRRQCIICQRAAELRYFRSHRSRAELKRVRKGEKE